MASSFKDHFSGGARNYAEHRPGYPEALFAWLATLAPARELAWDCATGNGQAATSLVPHFARVVASDASAEQVANRRVQPAIDYLVALAEACALRAGICDLITVAQSAHWFDFPRFYAEVRRVAKPCGVIALWTYEKFRIGDALDAPIDRFYEEVVGPYWPPERSYVEQGYRTLPFPFEEIRAPAFELSTDWTLEQVLAYLRTWSAVHRFRKHRGFDPVTEFAPQLGARWGSSEVARRVQWPLHLRVGRI